MALISTLGIVGGGQLGRMIAASAHKLGFYTHVLVDYEDSPASQVSSRVSIGDFKNHDLLRSFAQSVDFITLEFENIPYQTLEVLSNNANVFPSWQVLYVAQNRLREKELAKKLGILTPRFFSVSNSEELNNGLQTLGYPALMKTSEMGYDGIGQFRIYNDQDKQDALNVISDKSHYILEEFVDLDQEISLIIARDINGNMEFFPLAQNKHIDGILDTSTVPADIDKAIAKQAHEAVASIAQAIDLVGILAVEFFITKTGELFFNEMAPRPHNSGHWSLDACNVSQFEQLVRVVSGLPLQRVQLLQPCTMKNILGNDILNCTQYLSDPSASVTLYGKNKITPRRKMGHVNFFGKTYV